MPKLRKFKTLRELFRAKSRWTQGAFATDAKGDWKDPSDAKATCFCLAGGRDRVYGRPGAPGGSGEERNRIQARLNQAVRELYPRFRHLGIVSFNDDPGTTIEDIRRVVKLANV